jgi:ribosomal protein L31
VGEQNTEEVMTDAGKSLFEKHLQTFLLGLLSVLVVWFGRTTLETKDKVIVLTTTVDQMQHDVSSRMLDRYTGTQARSRAEYQKLKIEMLKNRLKEHDGTISEFEKRFDVLEKKGSDGYDH